MPRKTRMEFIADAIQLARKTAWATDYTIDDYELEFQADLLRAINEKAYQMMYDLEAVYRSLEEKEKEGPVKAFSSEELLVIDEIISGHLIGEEMIPPLPVDQKIRALVNHIRLVRDADPADIPTGMFGVADLLVMDDYVGGRFDALNDLVIGGLEDPALIEARDSLKPVAEHVREFLAEAQSVKS